MEIKEIAIYTNNQVITDKATIVDFLDRNFGDDVKSKFYFGLSSVPVPPSSNLLHFPDNNRVNIIWCEYGSTGLQRFTDAGI